MFGGTCTLIGTSTNLVVAGFQRERYPNDPKLSQMGIFDIAPYGAFGVRGGQHRGSVAAAH